MANIKIKNKENCCGCSACVDACSKQCIHMIEDKEGFSYPIIDEKMCIDCGRCVACCPFQNDAKLKNKLDDDISYAFVSNDIELIKSSSSSGAFWVIVENFVTRNKENFCVFGAAFEGIDVKHICAEDVKSATRLKKSKYVQSNTVGIYKSVRSKLEEGKAVLFSGTPCQVAALKAYLFKPYTNLLTVDIVCHGVPSQKTFSDYLNELSTKYSDEVSAVSFRGKNDFYTDKPNSRTVDVTFNKGNTINFDIVHCEYLYGFHTGLYMRPSCYYCKYASSNRPGDITLADYWGIEKKYPELQSNKGVSLVRFNTEKGRSYLEALKSSGIALETSYNFACKENHQLSYPSIPSSKRTDFIKMRRKGVTVTEAVNICKSRDGFAKKVIHKLESLNYNYKIKKLTKHKVQ